ncbi:OmpA family protein [Glacieibacterium megasporae]|uniref:OmpA family protein n=1 Tax=Glacieibacterium megasporae TaxID=2835787 RepID=UPI001C1DF651|nr:OmpA family protein [Polymorphobacter megasporae]UAJ08929.1 OmpA family protein [Polymorphobacter megasporae]
MSAISKSSSVLFLLTAFTTAVPTISFAQQTAPAADLAVKMTTSPPSRGPDLKGIISARSGDQIQISAADGTKTVVGINADTKVRASKGFLSLGRSTLAANSLLNGLPVTVRTMHAGDALVADQINLRNNDYKIASMIRNGTDQGFDEQTASTGALRGRVADIGQYNIKGTTNVNFDTGKTVLSAQGRADLCAAAAKADSMKNAFILVVGYTDSTGGEDYNQRLSEKRANRVVNYVQQACGWKPYRMLSPTGMAKADPLASNDSVEGKAQNRRVAVNILVSKGLDGL